VPCPDLVPLIESGHADPADPLLLDAAERYTAPLRDASAVLLGCTHYGIVEEALRAFSSEIDKAAKKGAITKNGAARRKSRAAALAAAAKA
jgi:glutamate racemase